ncbi:MAG TPA: glycosyltransferase [Candidatus Binatia bacterium]|jgi:GT2 family glycosyltransferase
MNTLAGKKALCFIALPHHNRFLVPIMEALACQGMEIIYFTAAAEGAFEITLNHAGLPYKHLFDYATDATARAVAEGYHELRSVLLTKVLGNRTMQSVPIVIQDKVIRGAVENYHCMNRMLEIEKPALVFALHELNPWGKILGYLSHCHRVPYFTLQEGLYYADLHYYRFHTDYSTACIVWGEECRDVLLRAGCSDDKIYPLGNTHIWNAKQEFTSTDAVLRARAAFNIPANKKIVLFLMSHSNYRAFEAAPFLRWMKERGDVVAVFKWHPVAGQEIVDRAMENLRNEISIINVHDFDTYSLIGASDVCITVGNSTTGLEALVFGKPLVEIRLPDQPYSYSALGVAEQAYGFEDLGPTVDRLLSEGLDQTTAANVEHYLARNFAYRDNATIDRIVDLARESIAAQGSQNPQFIRPVERITIPCSIALPVDNCSREDLLLTLNGIATSSAPELYEVLIVRCTTGGDHDDIFEGLEGDVRIMPGSVEWSYGAACNRAAAQARGKYVVFLKPGMIPQEGWLEGLLEIAEDDLKIGAVGGQVLNENRLISHVGIAFDVNQSPFPLYRYLPPEFSGAQKTREFRAVEFPFLTSREVFHQFGGFDLTLRNRFEDVDFCLRVGQRDFRTVYTPKSVILRRSDVTWRPAAETDQFNRIRFYSKWAGSLWQDEREYLRADGITHDQLSALYREWALRVAHGVKQQSSFSPL